MSASGGRSSAMAGNHVHDAQVSNLGARTMHLGLSTRLENGRVSICTNASSQLTSFRPKRDAQPRQVSRNTHDQSSSTISSRIDQTFGHAHSASEHNSLLLPSDTVDFCGPSSTEFTLNIATSKLQSSGTTLGTLGRNDLIRSSATRFAQYGPFMKLLTMDPLWDLNRQEAIQLVEDWCFGLGDVYPILPRQRILDTLHRVYDALELASQQGMNDRGGNVAEALFNHDANKLKIVLAISLTKETGGRNHRADRLFQSTSEAVEGLLWNPQGLHGVQLLYLTVSETRLILQC